MARVFETSSDIRNLITDVVYDLITDWGKVCRLYYPPKNTECINCTNGGSVWRTGGPQRFLYGKCPLCYGNPIQASETTEDITMLIDLRPKSWLLALQNIDVRNPDGLIYAKGFIGDLNKVKQCNFMQLMNIDAYGHQRFKLEGEPFDLYNIAQGKYFSIFWKRYG